MKADYPSAMAPSQSLTENIVRFGRNAREGEINYRRIISTRADDNIEIDDRPLGAVFDEVFRIPDYQRGYQWDEEQWEELWNQIKTFIEVGPESPKRINDVFFGSMFFSERNADDLGYGDRIDGDILDVIDGQQRVTTISIVFKILADELSDCLANSSPEFIRNHSEHVGIINNQIYRNGTPADGPALIREEGGAGGMESRANHNSDVPTLYEALIGTQEDKINHLLNRQEKNNNRKYGIIKVEEYLENLNIKDKVYLQALISTDDAHTHPNIPTHKAETIDSAEDISDLDDEDRDYFIEKNRVEFAKAEHTLTRSYGYFYQKFHSGILPEETEKRYRLITNIYKYILNCFQIGSFEVGDNDPRLLMRIFEVLNDQGVDLKKKDLIRTRIANQLRGTDQVEYGDYKDKWESVVDLFGDESDIIIKFLETYFTATDPNIHSRSDISNRLLEAFTIGQSNVDSDRLDSRIATVDRLTDFLQQLEQYARLYHHLQHPREDGFEFSDNQSDIEDKCNRILSRLREYDTDIWEPIVLQYYYEIRNNSGGSPAELYSLLQTVESLVIRFAVGGTASDRDATYKRGVRILSESDAIGTHIETALIDRAYEKTEGGDIFGADLIENLIRENWDSKRCKALLKKIVSEQLDSETDQRMLDRELNQSDGSIHLEHIFPQNPLRESDRYGWIQSFFIPDEWPDEDSGNIVDEDLIEIIEHHTDNELDDELDDMCDRFNQILGNHLLLLSRTNLRISNARYGYKLAGYASASDFEHLITSEQIIEHDREPGDWEVLIKYGLYRRYLQDPDINLDEVELPVDDSVDRTEWLEEEMESMEEAVTRYNNRWNLDRVRKNSNHLIENIMNSIQFDRWLDPEEIHDIAYDAGEFESVDVNMIVSNDFNRRQKYVVGNQGLNM